MTRIFFVTRTRAESGASVAGKVGTSSCEKLLEDTFLSKRPGPCCGLIRLDDQL